MFTRIILAALLALALTVPAVSAQAADVQGVYFTPKIVGSWQNTGDIHKSSAARGAGIAMYDQFALAGALSVGYDFQPQHQVPLRLEVEGTMRGNSTTSWYSAGGRSKVTGTWNTSTILGNIYYDFHNSSPFTPYVGVGAGVALAYSGYSAGGLNVDQYDTLFAWNAGLGFSWTINENFAADLGYRFVGIGTGSGNEVNVGKLAGTSAKITTYPYMNEVTMGLRCTF